MAPSRVSARLKARSEVPSLTNELPLDILFETFSYLQPHDLFRLSQTSKSLRAILLSPTVIFIWKFAFLNTDAVPKPPNVPSDINIVQYAGLLYGRHCHYCASKNATFVNWAARKRMCGPCLKTTTVTSPSKREDTLHTIARNIIPGWTVQRPGIDKCQKRVYLKDDVKQAVQKLSMMEINSGVFKLFVDERSKALLARLNHARLCEQWQSNVDAQHRRELEEIRRKRKDAVKEKLTELGWRDELQFLHDSEIVGLPGVNQAKELTNRAWNSMKDKVITKLEQLKAARLKKERQKLLRSRMINLEIVVNNYGAKQPSTKPLPNAADVAALEPFYSLLFKSPKDTTLDQSHFTVFQAEIAGICDKWMTSSSELLVGLLPKSLAINPDLDLATIFFRCHWCREPITYPRVLKHECLTKNHSSDELLGSDNELLQASHLNPPWNYGGEQVSFNEEGHICAKEIIRVCGQDPDSISMSEMDDLDYRVECLRCAHPSRGRLVMKWKTAILHDLTKKHYGEEFHGVSWALVSEDDTIQAKDLEGPAFVGCAHCRVIMDRNDMKVHLRQKHSIKCKRLEKFDDYVPLDTPLQPPYPVRIPNAAS